MGALFDAVRERVTAEDAARTYGLLTSSWQTKAVCPWHEDHDPSLSFWRKTGRCLCFVCHQGGSAIDLTAKLFQLSPLDAVRKLNADFKLGIDEAGHAPVTGENRAEMRKRFQAFVSAEHTKKCAALRDLNGKLDALMLSSSVDEAALAEIIAARDEVLARLDWLEHLDFDEWRREDAG